MHSDLFGKGSGSRRRQALIFSINDFDTTNATRRVSSFTTKGLRNAMGQLFGFLSALLFGFKLSSFESWVKCSSWRRWNKRIVYALARIQARDGKRIYQEAVGYLREAVDSAMSQNLPHARRSA
jgi:hypothetical protein